MLSSGERDILPNAVDDYIATRNYCSIVVITTTEEVAHVDVLFRLGSGANSGGCTTSGGGRSGSILECGKLGEVVVRSDGSASKVLEGVDEHMGSGGSNDVTGTERELGKHTGVGAEGLKDVIIGDAEHHRVDELATLHEGPDVHLVLEGHNLQFVKKSSLGRSDLVAKDDDRHGVDDLNLSLHDLGLDVKSLEETSLLRVHAGGASGDDDILGGEGTDLSGGTTDLGVEDSLDGGKITVSEDESGVATELISNDRELRAGNPVGLPLLEVLVDLLIGLSHEIGERGLEVGVLATDHDGVKSTELLAHNRDLLGGDVVDLDEEALAELAAGGLELGPSGGLGLFLGTLGHLVLVDFS